MDAYNNLTNTGNNYKLNSLFSIGTNQKLLTLDLGDKFNTANVTNMNGMFQRTGYESMTELNLGSEFDTSKVTDMSYMFIRTGYKSLKKLDLGDKFDTSKVTTMYHMFLDAGHDSLETLDLGTFGVNHLDNIDMTNIFYNIGSDGVLKEVIVKNVEVQTWLNTIPSNYMRDYVKNIITVES